MKSTILTALTLILISISGFSQQETKVYIKSNDSLGKFYVYVDSILMNRAPQIQVGILGLEEKPSYHVRVVFQDPKRMPIEGDIKPKLNKTKLFVLYSGTGESVKARKADKSLKDTPIPGDTAPSHPSMPEYKGRLGCDFPIDEGVLNQVVSQMTSDMNITPPMEVATTAVTTNCFTVKQLRQILMALEDDSDRVALAKIAWYYVYDQENFEKLEDAFIEPGQLSQVMTYVMKNQ